MNERFKIVRKRGTEERIKEGRNKRRKKEGRKESSKERMKKRGKE